MSIYLDYNATAPVRPEARERMMEVLDAPANPSSAHRFGRAAKKTLEDARKTIAEAISAFPNEVVFMACGTEANSAALQGFPGRSVIVSAVEHSSVLVHGKKHIPVDAHGVVQLAALDEMLAATPEALVSVMLANNETGVVQPIAEIAAICKRHGAILHVDAVQALGKIPVDFTGLEADMMSLAAHKMGGPAGAAALVVRSKLSWAPLLRGGGQELRRRAGTENIAAIAGFAKAVELIDLGHMHQLRGWLDEMEHALPQAVIAGKKAERLPNTTERLPNTSCLVLPGVSQEVTLMRLDLEGFAVSAGSACSSGRIEPSHVLSAMGMEEATAKNAIRISGGWATARKEIQQITEALQKQH